MIQADILATTRFDFRPYHTALAATSGEMIVADPSGRGFVLAADLAHRYSFDLRRKVSGLALSADGKWVAVSDSTGLTVSGHAQDRPLMRETGTFDGCAFNRDGLLCVARRIDDELVRIEMWDPQRGDLVAGVDEPDSFGDAAWTIYPHPEPRTFCIWTAAGQDGQCLSTAVLEQDRKLVVSPLTDLLETGPPSFDRTGQSFVVVTGSAAVQRYSFPDGALLGELECDLGEDNVDDAHLADSGTVILSTNLGRLYAGDLNENAVIGEIVIPGHGPRRISELYPVLAREESVATDLVFLRKHPAGNFLSFHRQLPSPADRWTADAMVWRIGVPL